MFVDVYSFSVVLVMSSYHLASAAMRVNLIGSRVHQGLNQHSTTTYVRSPSTSMSLQLISSGFVFFKTSTTFPKKAHSKLCWELDDDDDDGVWHAICSVWHAESNCLWVIGMYYYLYYCWMGISVKRWIALTCIKVCACSCCCCWEFENGTALLAFILQGGRGCVWASLSCC